MNVGPMGTGKIDPADVAILQGIGEWWKVNGESIRGTTRTPLPVQTWGESTRKGNTLYLHVFEWPTNGQLLVGGLKSDVKRVWLLAKGTKKTVDASGLKATRLNLSDVLITVPRVTPDSADSVVVVECAGEPTADRVRLLQPAFAMDNLRTFDAELKGGGLRFGPGKVRDAYVTGFSNRNQAVVWPVRLNEPAAFEVGICYDAEPGSAGSAYAVAFGDQILRGTVNAGTIVTQTLGRVSLPMGATEIRLAAEEIKGGEAMRPRSLTLKSVAR